MSHGFNDDLPLEPRLPWNVLQDTQARRLAENGLSRAQIVGVMKMTRSAVAGKLWRLKNGAASLPAVEKVEVIEEIVAPVKVSTLLPITIEKTDPHINSFHPPFVSNDHVPRHRPVIDSLFIPLLELPEDGCKFPVGGRTCCDKEHLFCGKEAYTPPGKKYHSPYCLEHHRMAYYRGY